MPEENLMFILDQAAAIEDSSEFAHAEPIPPLFAQNS